MHVPGIVASRTAKSISFPLRDKGEDPEEHVHTERDQHLDPGGGGEGCSDGEEGGGQQPGPEDVLPAEPRGEVPSRDLRQNVAVEDGAQDGQHTSAHGQHMVSTMSAHGRHMVSAMSAHVSTCDRM